MKKLKNFLGVALAAAVLFTSCDPKEPQIIEVESIKLSENALVLEVGQSQTLTANVLPADADDKSVVWTSSEDAIASVANGVVTANAAGTAIIIAKAGNKADTCEVSVSDPFYYESVVINGVKWAIRNVGAFGKFVANPEDVGMLYQWNRTTAYDNITEGAVTGWDDTYPTGTTWETTNDPCPDGWRIPTRSELNGLVGAATRTWTTQNGMNGMLFGHGSNTIFLPAAGYRNGNDGTLGNVGTNGYYWSSTEDSSNYAYNLGFSSGNAPEVSRYNKRFGYSVRCVAE